MFSRKCPLKHCACVSVCDCNNTSMQHVNYMHSIHHVVLAAVNSHAPAVLVHSGTGSGPALQQTPLWCCVMKTHASSSDYNVRRILVKTAGVLTVHHHYSSAFLVLVSSTYRLHHHSHIFCPTAGVEFSGHCDGCLVHGSVNVDAFQWPAAVVWKA